MSSDGMRLAHFAKTQPDELAVQSMWGNRTFFELNANSNRLARALRARGLRAGDGVAIVCSNRPEFAEAVHACLRAGFRYTPVNWHLTPDEIAYIVRDSRAKALVGDSRFASLLAASAKLAPDAEVRLAVGGNIDGFDRYDDTVAAEDGSDIDDPVTGSRMLYTSGTTGKPKGVVRPLGYKTGLTALTSAPNYAAGRGQLNLCTGPMHHGGPLVYSMCVPISHGVGTVLMDRWDAKEALRLIEEHRITHTHMVPTMFHRLLRLPEDVRRSADVSSLEYIAHGAAPCTVAIKRAMIDWVGPILWEYYAATEGGGASVSPTEWLEKPGTVGKPITDDHVQIRDESGNACAPYAPGTIYLKVLPDSDFAYFNAREKTAAAHDGAYFTVGDVGYLDDDGYLFLTDRSADLIVRGGVNVYPAEVEAVLLQHPAVRDAAVVGVPSEEWGEEVKGVVERFEHVENGTDLERSLLEHCRAHLARYKCPQSIDVVDRLPRSDNGKLYKRRLREHYRGTTHA
jgi:long-chain acyl-CoA synthetase